MRNKVATKTTKYPHHRYFLGSIIPEFLQIEIKKPLRNTSAFIWFFMPTS
jgi:hypothetical protein